MATENIINIGEAELETMKVLWKAKEPICNGDICKALESHGWKRTTISTFLARLVDKGAISAEKRGKNVFYTPIMSAREYKKSQVKALVNNVFDGSAQALVVSLFKDKALSDDDIAELRAIFDKKE